MLRDRAAFDHDAVAGEEFIERIRADVRRQ